MNSKEFLSEFINLYKNFPCLWKIKSKDYHDRHKKTKAYEELVNKLKEVDENASRETVIKKIDSIRGSFRRELKKMKLSQRSGAGTDEVYKPHLWYFDMMLFLMDQEMPRDSVSNIDNNSESSFYENDKDINDESPLQSPSSEVVATESIPDESRASTPTTTNTSNSGTRKRKQSNLCDNVLLKIQQELNSERKEDDYDILGKHLAVKLRRLPKDVSLVAEKLMMDILFEAQLGNINRNTRLNLRDIPTPIVVPTRSPARNTSTVDFFHLLPGSSLMSQQQSELENTNASTYYSQYNDM